MVYPGHRSTGCIRCKERRVKCDDTKPACLRCAKFGVICPGYQVSKKPDFMIINDTFKTAAKARKAYAKAGQTIEDGYSTISFRPYQATCDPAKSETSSNDNKSDSGKTSYNQLVIRPRLSAPLFLQGAVGSFISTVSNPTQDIYWGLFEQAAILYENGNQQFKASVEAMSLCELSLHQAGQDHNVRLSAVKIHGCALHLINDSISQSDQRLMDETILAIFLAIMFERRLNGGRSGGSGLSHFLAIMRLMQMKAETQLSTLIGRQLLLFACIAWHGMVMPLPQPIPCPVSDEICESLTTYTSDRHVHAYKLLPLFNRGISLRKKALGVLYGTKCTMKGKVSQINDILSRIARMEKSFKHWQNDLPPTWPCPVESSANLAMNSARAHRIFLDDLKVRCNLFLAKLDRKIRPLEQINSTALHTRQMVDQVCATMPYEFGLDTPRTRAVHVRMVSSESSETNYFYHISLSFPLLVVSMVDAGISTVQRQGILEARMANATAMRLNEPLREFPRVLVQVAHEHEQLELCKVCGTEVHYAHQRCPGPTEKATPADISLRQSLADLREPKEPKEKVNGSGN